MGGSHRLQTSLSLHERRRSSRACCSFRYRSKSWLMIRFLIASVWTPESSSWGLSVQILRTEQRRSAAAFHGLDQHAESPSNLPRAGNGPSIPGRLEAATLLRKFTMPVGSSCAMGPLPGSSGSLRGVGPRPRQSGSQQCHRWCPKRIFMFSRSSLHAQYRC